MADAKKLLSAQKNTTFFRGKIFLSRSCHWCYDAQKAVFNLKYPAWFWYTAVMWWFFGTSTRKQFRTRLSSFDASSSRRRRRSQRRSLPC